MDIVSYSSYTMMNAQALCREALSLRSTDIECKPVKQGQVFAVRQKHMKSVFC